MAKLQNDIVTSGDKDVTLSIPSKQKTGLTFAFLLGCLPLLASCNNINLSIKVNKELFLLLKKINVPDFFNKSINIESNLAKNPLPCFRQIREKQDIFNLVTDICDEAPVTMSHDLKSILISRIGEMFQNAIEHSDAKYIIGGKYFKYQKNKYCFSVYDTGAGIPAKVNNYYKRINSAYELSDPKAIEWAMAKGNSTCNGEKVSRGCGMDLLKSFAKCNEGTIRICSGRALYILNSRGETYYKLDNPFIGTLFEMDIIADNNRKYILK